MGRTKCKRCGKPAHVLVGKKYYCLKCAPKPTIPITMEKMERPKPWPDPPTEYLKPLAECIEKKSWWTKIIEFFDDRRPK